MEQQYFLEYDHETSVPKAARVQQLYVNIHASAFIARNAMSAFTFIKNELAAVEASAHEQEKKVAQYQNLTFCDFREMELGNFSSWSQLKNNATTIHYDYRSHQYLLLGANGAIEIHQQIYCVAIHHFGNADIYKNNEKNSLILKRPGHNKKDVWGNALLAPYEEFSKRQDKRGVVDIANNSLHYFTVTKNK